MLKTLIFKTTEIDDIDYAVAEIKAQLDAAELGANTVGIIACHFEFLHAGTMKAICEALPFPVVGTVTSNQVSRDVAEQFMLSIMVLTSDDVDFALVETPPLIEEPYKVIETSYNEVAGRRSEKPALAFAFGPFMLEFSGDQFVNMFTRISGGVPCFGTIAIDAQEDVTDCFSCINGEFYPDRMALILVYGDVHPKFFLATISPEKILPNPALVTKSAGNILMEVNGRPVDTYFADLGLINVQLSSQYSMSSLPLMLDYGDGTPMVSKVFIAHTPERYAVCAGDIPEGSTMYMGVFDKADVLYTTGEAMKQALKVENASGILMYSCVSRSMSLNTDAMAELDLVREAVGDKAPFLMAYSGGEICPTLVSDTTAINRFHNNAFVVCVF